MIRAALAALCSVVLLACSDPTPSRHAATRVAPPTTEVAAGSEAALPDLHRPGASGVDLEPQPPTADPYALARRFRGVEIAPAALTQPPAARIGDRRRFWV